jgi:outer membrane protein OmpA-like peptidoglycan-associated protein/tetratricopeptide (TPR) repeat protein
MKKAHYITLIGILFTMNVLAQDVEFKSGNFKDKKDEYKIAEGHYKKGEEYLKLGNAAIYEVRDPGLNFKLAILEFNKAYEFNPKSAMLNFYLGNAYMYTNDKHKAIAFLKEAEKLNPTIDDFLDYYLGMAAQLEMEFDKAKKYYIKFESTTKSKQIAQLGIMLDQRKKECDNGARLLAKPERVWIDNMKAVNTAADEYSPCLTMDGSTLLFTSNRQNGHKPDAAGEYDGDIYITELVKGKWSTAKNVGEPLNTVNDETASMLFYDGTKMLIFKKEEDNCDVFETFLKGEKWTVPMKLHKGVNTADNQTYASYCENRNRLYYLSDKSSGTSKGYDIYYSSKMNNSNTEFAAAQSVGTEVNTKLNEGSVFIHPNGNLMYFCSEGHNSMGGYDIFVAKKRQGQWQAAENLGYPINTPYDDMFFGMTASGKYAYIASNRAGGVGGMDIYKVTFWGEDKELAPTTEDFLLASFANPIQDVQIESKVKVDKQALTVFKGITIDAISRKPVEATIEITDNSTGKVIETFTTNSATGKFLLSLAAGKNYGIAVKAPGYLFHSENFDVMEPTGFNMINKEIELKNIKKGSKIALRNIFFDTGKSTLKTESFAELDRLVQLLKDVPALRIEISGHTDNVGSEGMNQKLSQDRADAVVAYLVSKGINASRLESRGYGSNRPIADNKSNEGRQQNRRTEFEILSN